MENVVFQVTKVCIIGCIYRFNRINKSCIKLTLFKIYYKARGNNCMKDTSDEDKNEFLSYQKKCSLSKNSETLAEPKQIPSGERFF